MQTKFIRIRELASAPGRNGLPARHGRLPISYATVWRWVKLGAFPKPVHLGPQTTAWRLEDIERWEAEHALCVKTSQVQVASAQKREAK